MKISKTGKFLHRHPGQNHFNAKASGRMRMRKKGLETLHTIAERKLKEYQ